MLSNAVSQTMHSKTPIEQMQDKKKVNVKAEKAAAFVAKQIE